MNVVEIEELLSQAQEAQQLGNHEIAEQLVLKARSELESVTSLGDETQEILVLSARAFHLLGMFSSRRGEYSTALSLYNQSLHSSTEAEDRRSASIALRDMGFVYHSVSDYPKAMECYQQALNIHEELGLTADLGSTLVNIGSLHAMLSNYPLALECFGKALSINQELGNETGIASCLGNIGSVHRNLSLYPEALEYYSRALHINEELGNKNAISVVLGNMGSVYGDLADYVRALEFFGKALDIAEELGSKSRMCTVLGNIGLVHQDLSDFSNALMYLSRALSIAEELGSKASIATCLANLGLVHLNLHDYEKALDYYSQALSINQELGRSQAIGFDTGRIGTIYLKLSNYPKALEYLESSMDKLKELRHTTEDAEILALLGELFANPSNLDRDESKAERYLLDSIALGNEIGTKRYEVHKQLALLYKGQERWRECAEHLLIYQELKDEVLSEQARKSAAQMEQRRQIAERQKEIAIAKAAADAQMSATTSLLYKVLPESVATRMINGDNEIADYYPQVSILFADIAGFTPLSADMPAIIVVRFLNFVFAEFDRIIKKHGCEKIKTIGDGYMAVCGAPIECPDHAERLAAAAVEMQQTIILPESIREHLPDNTKLGIRIGLHTGSVVAGVIGEERFVYDIYSDAVNIAARMESHGEEDKIHCSNDFYRHMQNRFAMTKNTAHGLEFEKRGEMEIKGKGKMRTYFMEKAGRRIDRV